MNRKINIIKKNSNKETKIQSLWKEEKGAITVFSALIFLVLLVFFFALIEGIYINTAKFPSPLTSRSFILLNTIAICLGSLLILSIKFSILIVYHYYVNFLLPKP